VRRAEEESPITWNTISRRKFIKEHEKILSGETGTLCRIVLW
jgi:hypothetical protein